MKRNIKLDKANLYRLSQEVLRNKALIKGVNLIAPETIFLSKDTSFGKNVTVEPYVVFGPGVKIGDNNTIREYVTISRGTEDKMTTSIGENCLIMAYSHIAHDCIIEDNCIIVNAVQIAGHSIVQEYAIVGGGSLVHQFTKIGCHSMISGGSIIRKDVPPYCKAGKEPLSYKGVNSIGLKRRNFNQIQINQIQNMFRILYLEGKNISQAINKISNEIEDSKEKEIILKFIKSSERGVIKGILD